MCVVSLSSPSDSPRSRLLLRSAGCLRRTEERERGHPVSPLDVAGRRERLYHRVLSSHITLQYSVVTISAARFYQVFFCFCAFVSFFPVNAAAATDDSGGDGDDDRHICVCLVLLFFFFYPFSIHARSRGNRPDVSAFSPFSTFLTYLRIPNSSR